MDMLGPVEIPVPPLIGDFPLQGDFESVVELDSLLFTHLFDSPGLKTEQRFYRGPGARRFRVRKSMLRCHEYDDLKTHWNEARGVWARFNFRLYPTDAPVVVRYGDPVLRFEHLAGLLAGDPGLTLIETKDEETGPDITASVQPAGRPSDALLTALLKSEQKLIPLVVIVPRKPTDPPMYLSDRRCYVNEKVYLPRLQDWGGLTQSMNLNNDSASFRFGNADNVWTELTKTVNLRRATLSFAMLDAVTKTILPLWSGAIRSWTIDGASRVIDISASEGAWELSLLYPTRMISRTCWKEFKSAWCPYEGELTTCDKSWEQCVERDMVLYFGGVRASVQTLLSKIKPITTGVAGYLKSTVQSASQVSDSLYQRVLSEIYTDQPKDAAGKLLPGMQIACEVAAGRDEMDYYAALGVVGEGPLGGYDVNWARHKLDDKMPHDPQKGGGFRGIMGTDPSTPMEYFGINECVPLVPGQKACSWDLVPPGSTYAAGTAFVDIRRTDEEGLQLSKVSERSITVSVTSGLGGWVWSSPDPASREWKQPLSNPVWIAANVFLRGLGMKADNTRPDLIPAAEMAAWLDLESIIPAADICDLEVPKMVGEGTERQFVFRGILREQKPVRDWMTEILNGCLGYYYFIHGKLGIGVRIHSGVIAGNGFTRATVLDQSFAAQHTEPTFNHLTGEFADEEYEQQLNHVQVYDIDHAKLIGSNAAPRFMAQRISYVGVSSKSLCARLTSIRLKEELGGGTTEEQDAARAVRFRSTIIALNILPGAVCSYEDPTVPNGRIEFRITRRTLNPDWTIDFEGTPTTDSMYNDAYGPKPDDVPAPSVPPERHSTSHGLAWLANEVSPYEDDPLYDVTDRTFDLWQDYHLSREGGWEASLTVKGEMNVNLCPLGNFPPLIHGVRFHQTGGFLHAGRVYYFVLAQRDGPGHGNFTPMSNTVAVWVPPGPSTARIEFPNIEQTPGGYPGYVLWGQTDPRTMCEQLEMPETALPDVLDFIGPLKTRTWGAPNRSARKVRIKAKRIVHAGIAGLQVQEVIGSDQIRAAEFIGSGDDLINQHLTVIADWSDGKAPLWNHTIVAVDPGEGIITVQPSLDRGSPEDSVGVGDVMIVRSQPTSADATSITNTLWQNSVALAQFGADGLEPDAEKGLLIRVIHGKGMGQTRLVKSNTRTTHVIDRPWTVIPDATSIYIVEEPSWSYSGESSTPDVIEPAQDVQVHMRVPNLADTTALVGAFLVDENGVETAEEVADYREIFVWAQPRTVREILIPEPGSPEEEEEIANEGVILDVTDMTVRVHSVEGETRNVKIPAWRRYFGRTLYIVNEGPGTLLVKSMDEIPFDNGELEMTVGPHEYVEITGA